MAKAVQHAEYGAADVLTVREIADPPPPSSGKVLIRVAAASVNPKDTFIRKGYMRKMTGEIFPRGIGSDFSGTVVAVGEGVTKVRPGMRVFGMINGFETGAVAELTVADQDEVAEIGPEIGWYEAAAMPLAALTSLQALRDVGAVTPGQHVCISGASGGVGLFGIQIAKRLGARVTAVSRTPNEGLCRDAGADAFVDYQQGDALADGQGPYDVVYDVFGNRSFGEASPVMTDTGVYISTIRGAKLNADIEATPDPTRRRARKVVVRSNHDDLALLADMARSGEIVAHLDAVYPMDRAADAHRHIEGKHTRGKVVIATDGDPDAARLRHNGRH